MMTMFIETPFTGFIPRWNVSNLTNTCQM